jgi:methylmalonyl-CoA mutase, C-terminal domain
MVQKPSERHMHMTARKVRILMARFGEGYESATLKLARAFSEAGYEVIYTTAQDPEAIVASAIQESVDHIGITTLPGTEIKNFARIVELLARENASQIKITAGGMLSEEEIAQVKKTGVLEFFPKGTSYANLIEWSEKNIQPVDY